MKSARLLSRTPRTFRGSAAVLLVLMCVSAAVAKDPKSKDNKLQEPPAVKSNAKGTLASPLTVLFGSVNIPGPDFNTAIKVRAYGLKAPNKLKPTDTKPLVPGPTFVFHPGDLVKLHLHNYLNRSSNPALNIFENMPQQGGPGQADDITEHAAHEISIPNNADITNLHVHGLHVDPKQDNVTLLILPEDGNPSSLVPDLQRLIPTINRWWTRNYKYQIPIDHVPGTFWYHSHKHGSTSTQVENGMAGTLLMLPRDDADSIVPGLWNADPKKTHDRVLVLQEIANFGLPQGAGTGKGTGAGTGMGKGPFVSANLNSPVTTLNGQYRPTLQLPVGQLERWRFIVAGANHRTTSCIWVGKIVPPKTLPQPLEAALQAITNQTQATAYTNGTQQFPNNPLVLTCSKIPGRVKLVAVDGVPMWQAVDISPTSPTLAGAGNRNDLLIQPDPGASENGPYYAYQNYPLLIEDLAKAYPALFGQAAGAAAAARFSALKGGATMNGGPAYTFVGEAGQPVPNALPTDPYALGTNYTGLSVQWPKVNPDGTPAAAGFASLPIGPLLNAKANAVTNGVDINIRANQLANGSTGWQPMPDAGGGAPANADILIALDISGKAVGPKMPDDAALNERLTQLSPATHEPEKTKLKRVNKHGQLVPGIPSYVSPIPDKFDGRQSVVFDRGQFTFDYINKSNGSTLQFRQFWINGRQFNTNDFIGNPYSTQLIQNPLINVEPELGSYSPNAAAQTWTHQHGAGIGTKLLITNPGYFLPVKSLGNNQFNYDYPANAQFKPPTYQDVTGLVAPRQPESTTAEEWLLINNSDLFHPFHIHISPFFVTEVGQLDYNSTAQAGKQWTLKNLKDSNSPFKWVAGNWWDVILLPPHGYVKMKTWMNVPIQLPANSNDPDSEFVVVDNSNVYGSWVLHCHILRHEDRGMMTLVNTRPKPTSLSGKWFPATGSAVTIVDINGSLQVTGVPNNAKIVRGNFNEGLGNPFTTQPWAGAMLFTDANGTRTFCVTDDLSEIVFSDGTRWSKKQQSLAPAVAPIVLTGDWTDGDKNKASITQSPTAANGLFQLKFTPKSTPPVWWGSGVGSWPGGVSSTAPPLVTFAGTQTLVNATGRNQKLNFCVTADGNSIVFGNGIKWTKCERARRRFDGSRERLP